MSEPKKPIANVQNGGYGTAYASSTRSQITRRNARNPRAGRNIVRRAI